MKWTRKDIELENIPSLVQQSMVMAKAGNPLVEQLRCVFTLEDKKIIYMIPLLDFIDSPPEKISKFSLCQMVS